MASSKVFHILAIANYRSELRLIKTCILNCRCSTEVSGIRFFNLVVRKHVKKLEILSVNLLKILGIEAITDQILIFKTCFGVEISTTNYKNTLQQTFHPYMHAF